MDKTNSTMGEMRLWYVNSSLYLIFNIDKLLTIISSSMACIATKWMTAMWLSIVAGYIHRNCMFFFSEFHIYAVY